MSISESSKPKHKWTFRIPVTAWLILVPWILIWCAVIIWTITAGLMNAGVAGRLSAYVMVLAAPYLITWLLWLLFRRSQRVASIIFTSLLLIMAAVMVGPKLAEIGRQARQSETHNQISHPADSAEWQRKFRELVSPEIRVLTRSLKRYRCRRRNSLGPDDCRSEIGPRRKTDRSENQPELRCSAPR